MSRNLVCLIKGFVLYGQRKFYMPITRNEYTVSTTRSGSYILSAQPSELAMYTSKYLTEYERRFFVDNLEVQSIEFSGESNCQIFCRTLIHDLSKPFTGQFPTASGDAPIARGSSTILCLHAFAKLTTSWTWIKFAVTLFRQGFNVVMVDLPGFGRSSISRDIRCPAHTWRNWEVPIMSTLVNDLGLKKVNIMACYQSASIFFHILQEYPQLLGRHHVLHNPLFDDAEMTDLAMSAVIKKLLTGGYKRRVFVSFDRNHYTVSDPHEQAALSHRLILSERYIRQVSKSLGFNQIMTSSVSSLDIAEICLYNSSDQPGMRAVHALYPSKSYRIYVCQFMAGENLIPFPPAFSIPDELVFKNTASLTKSIRARSQAASSMLNRAPQSKFKIMNTVKDSTYSYGVRIRNMQDDLATQVAMTKSENDFREQYGDQELARLQTKVEAKSTISAMPNYLDTFHAKQSDDDDVVHKIITLQGQLEESARVPLDKSIPLQS